MNEVKLKTGSYAEYKAKKAIYVCIDNEALANALGEKTGTAIKVVSRGGIPTSREWRNRIRDSKRDNCVHVIKNVTQMSDKAPTKTKSKLTSKET